jgi:hypothetical protein
MIRLVWSSLKVPSVRQDTPHSLDVGDLADREQRKASEQ